MYQRRNEKDEGKQTYLMMTYSKLYKGTITKKDFRIEFMGGKWYGGQATCGGETAAGDYIFKEKDHSRLARSSKLTKVCDYAAQNFHQFEPWHYGRVQILHFGLDRVERWALTCARCRHGRHGPVCTAIPACMCTASQVRDVRTIIRALTYEKLK